MFLLVFCVYLYVCICDYMHICVCVCTWGLLCTCGDQMGEKFKICGSLFFSVSGIWWSKAFKFCVMSFWVISSTLMVHATCKLGMTKNHNERESQWGIMYISWHLVISAGICLIILLMCEDSVWKWGKSFSDFGSWIIYEYRKLAEHWVCMPPFSLLLTECGMICCVKFLQAWSSCGNRL